jgi:hypothetical protein
MPDEVNWDNVHWNEPMKYNPAEGIPPARPVSCPEAQLLDWLLAYQAGLVVTLPAGTSALEEKFGPEDPDSRQLRRLLDGDPAGAIGAWMN